jgi:hypothetical protein
MNEPISLSHLTSALALTMAENKQPETLHRRLSVQIHRGAKSERIIRAGVRFVTLLFASPKGRVVCALIWKKNIIKINEHSHREQCPQLTNEPNTRCRLQYQPPYTHTQTQTSKYGAKVDRNQPR